jgi:hypothetical protein
MLKPTQRDVTMHTTVEITSDESSICLEVTYYFIKKASSEPIKVQIEQLNNKSDRLLKMFNLTKNSEFHWAKKKINAKSLQAGTYKISITIAPHAAFIGDISFCKKREHYL